MITLVVSYTQRKLTAQSLISHFTEGLRSAPINTGVLGERVWCYNWIHSIELETGVLFVIKGRKRIQQSPNITIGRGLSDFYME